MESMMKDVRVETQIKYLQAGRKKLWRSTDCCFKFCMDRSSFWSSPSLLSSMYVQGAFLPAMGDSSSGSCSVSSFCLRHSFSKYEYLSSHSTDSLDKICFTVQMHQKSNNTSVCHISLLYFTSKRSTPWHYIMYFLDRVCCLFQTVTST